MSYGDWISDVCSSDLRVAAQVRIVCETVGLRRAGLWIANAQGGLDEIGNRVKDEDCGASADEQADEPRARPPGPGPRDARRDRGAWRALEASHAGQSPMIEFHSLTNTGWLAAKSFQSEGKRSLKSDRRLPVGIGPASARSDP